MQTLSPYLFTNTMKKIKYLVSLSGPNYTVAPGDEREVDAAESARLIAAGFAEAVSVPEEKKSKK